MPSLHAGFARRLKAAPDTLPHATLVKIELAGHLDNETAQKTHAQPYAIIYRSGFLR